MSSNKCNKAKFGIDLNMLIDSKRLKIVQQPFAGTLNEINVIENKTLFQRTLQKDYKQSSACDLKTSSKINITDSNCDFSHQFFTHSNVKTEGSTIGECEQNKSSRAKTPALDNYNSQIIEENVKLSPHGILKKPQTAKIGVRKQVHYNNVDLKHDFTIYNNGYRYSKIENILDSSYFKHSQSSPPRQNIIRNTQDGTRINTKIVSGIMPGNCKEHMTIKNSIKSRLFDILKYSRYKVFESLSKESS